MREIVDKRESLSVFRVSGFERSKQSHLKFFLEFKDKMNSKTEMSISFIVNTTTSVLKKDNEWKIASHTHMANYEKKSINSLRNRTLEAYVAEMKYLKVDFNTYFKSSRLIMIRR